MPVLALDRVRYVGEPVAIVVAETLAQAQDAAEAVRVDLDELPARPTWSARSRRRAGDLGRGAGQRRARLDGRRRGGRRGRVRPRRPCRARAAARHPRWRRARWSRAPRIGACDAAAGRYTLIAGTQGVAVVRKLLAEGVFKVPPSSSASLTHDVGGGFGMKVQAYPEYAALLYAARRVGGRSNGARRGWRASSPTRPAATALLEGELALDADGKFLALRVRTAVGIGAYTSTFAAIFATTNTKNCLSSVYVIPAIHIGVKMVLTNAAPLGPYRGAGRPEAIYLIERLIDVAARRDRHRPRGLRRRNFIPPSAMPYRTPNGPVYDSGEFEAVMDKALALADWHGFAARRARPRARASCAASGSAASSRSRAASC